MHSSPFAQSPFAQFAGAGHPKVPRSGGPLPLLGQTVPMPAITARARTLLRSDAPPSPAPAPPTSPFGPPPPPALTPPPRPGPVPPQVRTPIPLVDRPRWFHEHFHDAATTVVEFLGADGISMEGMEVADVGCGDGITDLGLVHAGRPAHLVGFDAVPTDRELLRSVANEHGVAGELPPNLEFRLSTPEGVPAEDDSFDLVVSWSVFEHAADPAGMAREIRRILRPSGLAMIQLWPFYHSEHGSHLYAWFPGGFLQFMHDRAALEAAIRANPGPDPAWAEYMVSAELNQITLDDLQRALLAAGMRIDKVELLAHAFHIPPALAHLPLSQLAVGGVKLLARPQPG